MGKLQGYIKPIKSTTLRVWRKDREEIELAWDGYDILLYRNGKYLRKITETPTIQIEVWDPEKSYLAGDNFVSYKSPDYEILAEDDPLSDEYIYRCAENTSAGESPATHPEKWLRQGKVGEQGVNTIFLSDVSGLEESLNERVEYTDFSEEFSIDPDSKEISLNIDYITLSNVSGKDFIQPGPNEVKIGNTIWKDSNETWDDGEFGVFTPGAGEDTEKYGLLYDWESVQRLLAANPEYRLPTQEDYYELREIYPYGLYDLYADGTQLFTPDIESWDSSFPWQAIQNNSGLGLQPAGYLTGFSGQPTHKHKGFIPYIWAGGGRTENPYADNYVFDVLGTKYFTNNDYFRFYNFNIYESDTRTAFPVRLIRDI